MENIKLSLTFPHTGCFFSCGHSCSRWFSRPLWPKKM